MKKILISALAVLAVGAVAFDAYRTHSSQTRNNVHDLFLAGTEALAYDPEHPDRTADTKEQNCTLEVEYCEEGGVEVRLCDAFKCWVAGHKTTKTHKTGVEKACIDGDRLTPTECAKLSEECKEVE